MINDYIEVCSHKDLSIAAIPLEDLSLPQPMEDNQKVRAVLKNVVDRIISQRASNILVNAYYHIYEIYQKGVIDGKTIRAVQALKRAGTDAPAPGQPQDTSWNRVLA